MSWPLDTSGHVRNRPTVTPTGTGPPPSGIRCSPRAVQVLSPSGRPSRTAISDLGSLGMCRNIHVLHNFDPPATSDEVMAAALQYVRKVARTTKPSKANEEAFEETV